MKTVLSTYSDLVSKYGEEHQRLTKKSNIFGFLRFLVFVGLAVMVILYIRNGNLYLLGASIIATAGFVLSIKIHNKLQFKRDKEKSLMDINQAELDYLERKKLSFYEGSEYIDQKHPFSHDLDFFGKDSLYHHINRTASYSGQTKLAEILVSNFSVKEIAQNQDAISDLSERLEFRQNINAIGKIAKDSREFYEKLIEWSETGRKKPSRLLTLFSYVSPFVLVGLLILYFTLDIVAIRSAAVGLFILNLGVLSTNLKGIKREIVGGTKIDKIIKNYSLIIDTIEAEEFKSEKLNLLKEKLKSETHIASREIKKLSSLFSQLDTLFNLIGAAISNGLALQHIHVYRALVKWKRDNKENIVEWLDVIGEIEALNCLANFSFNNPGFIFPDLNEDSKIQFSDLGHPLIDNKIRINNDVDFNKQGFIVLTGSNMSGKSTFLRSLGVNMVLAGIGSVICASKANVNPLKVWVSMRLSDSLEDNESYFFAEVKRLKEIMDQAEKETSFILLDEILRGTNSEDKHTGTVEVIKKLVSKGAIGAAATHDLKVCFITDENPDELINKCFEVEIISNELSFDYKLRDGICKSKNATFLMEKMGVI